MHVGANLSKRSYIKESRDKLMSCSQLSTAARTTETHKKNALDTKEIREKQ